MSSMPGDFASRFNINVMEEQYARYQSDPESVSDDWKLFFAGFELGMEEPLQAAQDPSAPADSKTAKRATTSSGSSRNDDGKAGRTKQQRIDALIYAYRDNGHSLCKLDPIGFNNRESNPNLELNFHGLEQSDLDVQFATEDLPALGAKAPLRNILEHLKKTYCGEIGVEYQHIQDPTKRNWVRDQIEPIANQPQLDHDDKRRVLIKLSQAELLENFIHTKFLGQKRFSLEGGESMIPGLDAIVEGAPDFGVKEVVVGMAHRGRLNVLANILNKSYEEIFTEFEGSIDQRQIEGDGDVKYHMGFSSDHITAQGRKVHLTLTANPSHLEAVNPLVLGRTRAKQRQHNDTNKRGAVLPIIIHGDAAVSGQGLVMETLQLSQLEGYSTGGTVHIVLNNQIGFTTLPGDSRSTPYCTDIAKMMEVPVFHVNGDNPEAVVHACKLALAYRQTFGHDAFVDLVCYRRFGHNETDEPNYTQPTMYALINKHPRITEVYTDTLLKRKDLTQDEIDSVKLIMKNQLDDALESVKVQPVAPTRTKFRGAWQGFKNAYKHDVVKTGVDLETIDKIGKALSTWPSDFAIHRKIKRLATERGRIIQEREPVDWALGELLAFSSLLVEEIPVRLSGQDSRRGTFSQRHSYWYDTNTRERYKPLNHISDKQATFCVYNSPLSEAGVLGFDYGYSIAEPNMLIIWEAQFGDFANGAQVIIDQFICSSESKWGRYSGIVLMLPHGQEGMGPEHSSARLERFLAAAAENNIQVANCTTAAQHFHILRRQMHRAFRKPLILMTPKSHLRSKDASSELNEFVHGHFQEVIDEVDSNIEVSKVKRIVLAGGKVIHDLRNFRKEKEITDTAVISVEQLYPFPKDQLAAIIKDRQSDIDVVWCQEETQNMGAWHFIRDYLAESFGKEARYAGREAGASPAPGTSGLYKIEQQELLHAAFGLEMPDL